MFKKIILVVVVLIAGLAGFAATKPNTFRVERSTTIKAKPEKVFALIEDFHNWGPWSPWEKMDPAMKRTYSGPQSGKGAVYEWDGNDQVGKGRMEILDAPAPTKVVIKLDFLKPFEGHNTAEFSLKPNGESTDVSWVMFGPANFLTKLISVFCSMDKLVGKDFETGLANMKAAGEK